MKYELRRPIICDTETNYTATCSIKANRKTGWVGGNWHYTHHPQYYCYMISWCDPITGESGVLDDRNQFPAFIERMRDRTLVAHNCGFDLAVLKSIVPDFEPFNTFDTADMAAYLQSGRSLAVASEVLLGRKVDKTMRDFMQGKEYHEIGADNQRLMREYALADAINEADLFKYGVDLWPDIEKWISAYTLKQNWEGVSVDSNYLDEQVDKVSRIRSGAISKIPWVENIDEDKPMSPKQLALYCREVGILPPTSLAEDSEECAEWEATYGDQYPVVGAIRDFRKSNTFYRKLMVLQALIRPDGTIPLDTLYAAAPHTLRWSARGFNHQNLPRPEQDGTYKFADLRGCLIPRAGTKFAGTDLAGIENRCLPWLAGDREYLREVALMDKQAADIGASGGGDVYEPFARRMFHYKDPRPLRKADKDLRNITKVCVLQLGYQSGARKFHWFISQNVEKSVLDRVREGDESDEALAARLVRLYRGTNKKVTDLWRNLDGELRAACTAGDDFRVQQPNGRVVHYRDLAVRATVKPDGSVRNEVVGSVCRGDDKRANLYGGKITENLCQEMARHVLVHSIYNLDQAGYKTKFSVHDENVIEVPEEKATKETCMEIEKIMGMTPSWAPGLPLAAETSILDRYSK